jgi:hypothetical protein
MPEQRSQWKVSKIPGRRCARRWGERFFLASVHVPVALLALLAAGAMLATIKRVLQAEAAIKHRLICRW